MVNIMNYEIKYDTRDNIASLLSENNPKQVELIRKMAHDVLLENCGSGVYYRGLIEFSNRCVSDCYYCGIRRSNADVNRFDLTMDEIVDSALWCAKNGYGSIVLQSGENSSRDFIDFVCRAVETIKKRSVSEELPNGLGVTLCIGEQSEADYARLFAAGAHRYLLRIETSNRELFKTIHPEAQSFDNRVECLRRLKRTGFQVGTGVMYGLPGQTYQMLADDILFFKGMDIDMLGMGPYIRHSSTPLKKNENQFIIEGDDLLRVSLLMIAACRLVLKDINIAATTALQTIDPTGREKGLSFGANVVMPQLTPVDYRKSYLLYDNKPCQEDTKEECKNCLSARVGSVGREVHYNEWGDSPHFKRKGESKN